MLGALRVLAAALILFVSLPTQASTHEAGAGASSLSISQICTSSESRDFDEAPLEGHRRHHHHCMCCAAAPFDAPSRIVALVVAGPVLPFAFGQPDWLQHDDPAPPQFGWVSSWSAQAPPFFS